MTQSFAHFHDTHNSCIDLVLTILIDSLFRCLLFFRLQNEHIFKSINLSRPEIAQHKANHLRFLSFESD